MENICKHKYLKQGDKILFENIKIFHSGLERFGPESDLYDYLLVIQRGNKILYEIFYREYWYEDDEDDELFLPKYIYIFPPWRRPKGYCSMYNKSNYKSFENNVIRVMKKYERYSSENILESVKKNTNQIGWGDKYITHEDIIKYLTKCKTVYEWWEDKDLIGDLKRKFAIHFQIIKPYIYI